MDIAALQELQNNIQNTWSLLKLDETAEEISALEKQTLEPSFWDNPNDAQEVSQRLSGLKEEYNTWEKMRGEAQAALEMAELLEAEPDVAMEKEISDTLERLQKQYEELEFYVLFSGQYDKNGAIVSFHAGAGGDDAQDWAEMLMRMVLRFCEKKGWKATMLSMSKGGEAGIKSAMFEVQGRYAYGHLRSESGVHRLVRISPFDAEAMRHTSFAKIEVIPDLGDIAEVEIPDSDLRIDVFRAGGNGGQSVNTTDSAVRIVHEPTGITVTCQNEKSQHQNKAQAMKVLKSKLYQKQLEEQEAERRRLKGEPVSAEWGSQIRSYVLHPYKMVKDHRTNEEVKNPDAVLDGDLQNFIEAYLRWQQE